MKLNLRIFFLCVIALVLFRAKTFAQDNREGRIIDSLKLALKAERSDTTLCRALNVMIEEESDSKIWSKYNEELKNIAAKNLLNISPKDPAFVVFKMFLAFAYQNKGFLFKSHGNIPGALENYSHSLKILEEISHKYGRANSLINIGSVYHDQHDLPKALEYYLESLKIQEEMGEKTGIANALNNIGSVYLDQENPAKALEYYNKCLKIREEVGDKSKIAICLNNIGVVYRNMGDISNALKFYLKGLKIREQVGDKRGVASSRINLGFLYLKENNYRKGLEYGLPAKKLADELGFPELIRNAADLLAKSYKGVNNHQMALLNYELFIQMRDSISNESTRKASIKSQLKYEYEKQAAADSVAHAKESEIKNVQLQKQTAEIKAKKNQQYALFGGLGLVMIFAGFMFNRFKVTQKQKGIIELQKFEVEKQKHLVDEKQKEVMDSIRYAQRIQRAQLPNENYITKCLSRLKRV